MTTLQVEIAEVQLQSTLVVRARTTLAEFPGQWRPMLDAVHSACRAIGVQPGRNLMLYAGLPDALDVEVGILCDDDRAKAAAGGNVTASTLPGGLVARTLHVGAYERLGETHAALDAWCTENGHRLSGVRWEIYGHWREGEPPDVDVVALLEG